ncbi:hypothetical protein SADUNF_Sadunf16G0307400 [Salix dunnii]|uniref:Uncharacterized protein n=1 Tax=Salix dunnii TaxID=1413687 RepID=A0A835MI02_9ROSI|nr:hypothetical protein SADUNF_Sadunf16G0307400 [Salix dunnii]
MFISLVICMKLYSQSFLKGKLDRKKVAEKIMLNLGTMSGQGDEVELAGAIEILFANAREYGNPDFTTPGVGTVAA